MQKTAAIARNTQPFACVIHHPNTTLTAIEKTISVVVAVVTVSVTFIINIFACFEHFVEDAFATGTRASILLFHKCACKFCFFSPVVTRMTLARIWTGLDGSH